MHRELGCGGVMLKGAKHGHNIFMYTITRGSVLLGDPVQGPMSGWNEPNILEPKRYGSITLKIPTYLLIAI